MALARFSHIDGLRTLSILWAMAFHAIYVLGYFLPPKAFAQIVAPRWLSPLLQGGHLGVETFFVISGFLVGSLLMSEWKVKKTIFLGRFYARRALRLLPAYYVAMALFAGLLKENTSQVWANILYVNNYLPFQKQFMPWTWSLAIEEQFYIVCPLFLMALLSFSKKAVLFFFAVVLSASVALTTGAVIQNGFGLPAPLHPVLNAAEFFRFFDGLYDKTHLSFGGLALGLMCAYLYQFTSLLKWLNKNSAVARLLGGLALLLLVFFTALSPFHAGNFLGPWGTLYLSGGRILFSLAIALVLFLGFVPAMAELWPYRFLRSRFFYPIAQLSYSAYLLHITLFVILYKLCLPHWPPTGAALCVYVPGLMGLALLAARALFVLVERPMMRLRDRRLGQSL